MSIWTKEKFGVLAFVVALAAPSLAVAWDFSCSPRTSTEVKVVPPPNIMLMLDRSGSMDNGERVRTCRVCEEPDGTRYEVSSASDCSPRGIQWAFSDFANIPQDNSLDGYEHSFSFNVPPAVQNIDVTIYVGADFGGLCEFFDIEVDGVPIQTLNPNYGGGCQTRAAQFTIPPTFAADGVIDVRIIGSPDNNTCGLSTPSCSFSSSCDGVDASCNNNFAYIELDHRPRTYWGSQAWKNPCGVEDKWDQAVEAIDLLTDEGQSTSPEQAHFGLGYYHQNSTAEILEECRPSNHDPIMDELNAIGPSGGTPTALGIYTAANSQCVSNPDSVTQTQRDDVRQNSSNQGYDQILTFTNIPPGTTNATIDVGIWGDFGSSCEFADVIIDGITVGRMTGSSDCNGDNNPIRRTFNVPSIATADGTVTVMIDTRGRFENSTNPNCGTSSAYVNAYCSENGAEVSLTYPENLGKGSASVLINDGEPTKSYGGRSAYHAAIYEACQHRKVANLYVLGLGTGTDEDFNNILAAAGGTGTCTVGGNEVDPCDDPGNWSSLRNDCTGSYQADDGAAMLAALAAIRDEIACTYPIDFLNSNRTDVPIDPNSDYEYVAVEVLRGDTGLLERVYHVNSPSNPTPGLGWDFASNRRQNVRLSTGFCQLANSGVIETVETQLACLCQETPGDDCTVPNASDRGVCPEGIWTCREGIDICQPDDSCCEPGVPCDTGLEGVCQQGRIVCDGTAGIGRCVPINEPSEEVCDDLDNDCNGLVDDIDPVECTVPNETGRCAAGVTQCDGMAVVCNRVREPYPEICNGLDDDCDGEVDNITQSWSKPQFDQYTLTREVEPLTCSLRNLCVCPGESDDHAGFTFDEYIDNWDPACVCGAGVEWSDDQASSAEPSADTDAPRTGCATGSGAVSPLLLLFGLFALLRRRR